MSVLFFFSLFAYCLGSLSSGVLACRLMKLPDPRSLGSKNPGATNILRVGGKWLASVVLLSDILKGFIPVWLGKFFGLSLVELSWIAFFAFIGHLFPVFFKFRGGKGVATALGGTLALSWPIGLVGLMGWMVAFFLFYYVSLASIIGAIVTFIYVFYRYPFSIYFPFFLTCLLLIFRHHTNIHRLIKGIEPKFTTSKSKKLKDVGLNKVRKKDEN